MNRHCKFSTFVSAVILLIACSASAQVTTNAFDVAGNYGSFTGNQGFGFGGWTINTHGGGKYISADTPPYFGIWNSSANSVSTAVRPFTSVLEVGQTFRVQLMMTTLDTALQTNGIRLQDKSGKVLFSFWHQGGDTADAHFTDGVTTNGLATGFALDPAQMHSFAFTLTSPTNYTFGDLSAGASFSGTLAGTNIAQITFLRANGTGAPSNGQDFKFNALAFTFPEPAAEPPDLARVAFDAYNAAFLVRTNGQTYYKRSLTNNSYAGSWVQALEIQLAEDAYDRTKSVSDKQLVNNLATTFLAKENYDWALDTWNDDIAWMTIACVRGFQITGNSNLLNQATNAWNMAYNRGWDSALGGGIWEEMNLKDAKCALSNDPMIIAGAALYQITGQPAYLTKCQNIYAWVRSNIFNPTNGQVYEGVRSNGVLLASDNVYNNGAFINAANCLFKITGATNYFQDALLAAKHVIDNNAILSNNGRGDSCWEDQFSRGLANFARDNNLWPIYSSWLGANTNAAWKCRRTDRNITWNEWTRNTLTDESFSLECLSAAVIHQVLPQRISGAPVFTLQPVSQITAAGNAISLSTLATNGEPIVYQWYHENSPLPGATGTSLRLLNVSPNDAGQYWVVASNAVATAYSQVASIHLIGNTNGFLAQDSATNYNTAIGFSGNQGFGFGPWTLSTMGGGRYISIGSSQLFALWNSASNAQSTATRPFNFPLPVGASFLAQLQMNTLDNPFNQNGFRLQDANGNTLFSYWHQGGDNANGHYSDASTANGTAVGFAYDFGQLDSFKFTLNSPTNYTFADLTTAKNFSGRLSGEAISAVVFFRTNGPSIPSGGQDFKFSNLAITVPPTTPFASQLEINNTGEGWSFHFPVAPGYSYRLQRATNVAGPWTDVRTLTAPASGLAQSIETNAPDPQGFYRTVSP